MARKRKYDRLSKGAACLAAALAIGACAASAAGAPSNSTGTLKRIEKELVEKAAEESRLKNEAVARDKELKALRGQMIDAAGAVQEAEQKISDISTDIRALEDREIAIARNLNAEQERLSEVLGALQSLEMTRPPALLVSPDDANKAARIAMLLSQAAPALDAKAAELRASLAELASINAQLTRERTAFQTTSNQIAARREVLSELLTQKSAERDVAARLAAAAQRETAALAARATSLRDVLRRLERFARVITPRIKPPPARSQTPTAPKPKPKIKAFTPPKLFSKARGALKSPVAGRLAGSFGTKRPEGGKFEGVRFITSDNALVTAPFDAEVAFARAWNPIGNLIVLDVGEGYHILLMGVGSFYVEAGQEVAAGEPLGVMRGRDARLDLEIRRSGDPVNPSLWLSGDTPRQTNNGTAY